MSGTTPLSASFGHSEGDRTLARATLADRVADDILADIYEQGLPPGTVLPSEADLAKTFGVSRLVVREAVRTLVAREVLDSGQGRPARVREPSSKILNQLFDFHLRQKNIDSEQIFQTRLLLEGQLASDAASRVRDGLESTVRLRQALDDMAAAPDVSAVFLTLDDVFHGELAEIARNPIVSLIMDGLHGLLGEVRERSYSNAQSRAGNQGDTIETHERVVRAIERGEPDLARTAMHALIVQAINDLHGTKS